MTGLCFVVMGFGKKTDYSATPRTLDLDATYDAIIKPAVTAAGLECIRADEVSHSGIIDVKMFELLLRADVVIADISTANPNALYELGVRHALRPFSTIVIKEIEGKFHFDLNHIATLQYKHLGEDIGAKEAAAKSAELRDLIKAVLGRKEPDSPVYTFLTRLKQPVMSEEELLVAARGVAQQSESVASEVEEGRKAALESKHALARKHFARARDLQRDQQKGPPDPFIVQQLALHTYKAKEPDALAALRDARNVIEQLSPAASTDPETLGITGAIEKRLWEETRDRAHLEMAIELYGRGFQVKRDYYNGENYAVCLNARAALQTDPLEVEYDTLTARKVRERIIDTLRPLLQDEGPGDRPRDYAWMLATMAGTHYALGRPGGEEYERRFRATNPPGWAIETFERGKQQALAKAGKSAS